MTGPGPTHGARRSGSATPTPPTPSTRSYALGSPSRTHQLRLRRLRLRHLREFLHATKTLRDQSTELEFTGPTCTLRNIDLGVAVGSAARTAAAHCVDCRCQTRIAVAARKLGLIDAEVAAALSRIIYLELDIYRSEPAPR